MTDPQAPLTLTDPPPTPTPLQLSHNDPMDPCLAQRNPNQ